MGIEAKDEHGEQKTGVPASGQSMTISWLRELALIAVIALVLSFLAKTFLFRAFFIPSPSMKNTLDLDDRIFTNLLVPAHSNLARGDIVVFRDTKGWLPAPINRQEKGLAHAIDDTLTFVGLRPETSEQHLVKRIIGLPGDHVVCCDSGDKITINGAALAESYVNPAEVPAAKPFNVIVPEGKIWVMGDNRNHSADSRFHTNTDGGFIDIADVVGKAEAIIWPPNHITILNSHPNVFTKIPTP